MSEEKQSKKIIPDTQSQIDQIYNYFTEGRIVNDTSKTRIKNFVERIKNLYGFLAIENPAPGYNGFVRLWRAGLVFKENKEIKSSNLIYYRNPESFFDIQNGQNERKAVLDETKYDAAGRRATIMNGTTLDINVNDKDLVSLQDYDGVSYTRNISDIIRDVNLLANAMLEPEDMPDEIFKAGYRAPQINMSSDRDFTPEAKDFIGNIIANEINVWKDFIHKLSDKELFINKDIYECMKNMNLPSIDIYNWVMATDIKDNRKDEIHENRLNVLQNWPMMVPYFSNIRNTMDPYYIAISNGDDLSGMIAEDANVSIDVVNKIKGLSPSSMGYDYEISKKGYFKILNNLSERGLQNLPDSPEKWEEFTLINQFIDQVKPYTDKAGFVLPLTPSEDIDREKIKKAIELIPLVVQDYANTLIVGMGFYAHKYENQLGLIKNGKDATALAMLTYNKNFDDIIDSILNYYEKIPEIHQTLRPGRYTKFTAQDWMTYVKSDSNSVNFQSGYKVKFYKNYYELYEMENESKIPLISYGYDNVFNCNQLLSIQDASGNYLGGVVLNNDEVKRIVNMDVEESSKDLSQYTISEIPSFIKNIVTKDGTEASSELKDALWELDSAFRSGIIKPNFDILEKEKELRIQNVKSKTFNYSPWNMDLALYIIAFQNFNNNNLLPDYELNDKSPIIALNNINNMIQDMKEHPVPDIKPENKVNNTPYRPKPKFVL